MFPTQDVSTALRQGVPLTRSALRLLGALFASLLLLPAGAHAAQITGDVLSIASDDETGRLGAAFTGSGITEFCCTFVDTTTGAVSTGNAGFVVTTVDAQGSVRSYGSRRSGVTPTGGAVVTGTGSEADPFRLIQNFRSDDGAIEIHQEIVYVNGRNEFRAVLDVKNTSGAPLRMRASMGADLTGGGSDQGSGIFEPGPPRFVGGFNFYVGAVAGLVEVTSWTHFEEGQYSDVLGRADGDPRETQLADVVEGKVVDNGAAVQWDQHAGDNGFPAGAGAHFEVVWRFTRTYNLTPERQNLNTGDTASFDVGLTDTSGQPQSETIRWTVTGSNNASGDFRTDANGKGSFEYVGANPGIDRVEAYVDTNDNGIRDEGEPQREATVEWVGPDAPQFATEVNVRPAAGRVLVRLPRGANVKGKWAQAAQSRFVRLTEAKQLPVGTEMDTKRGTVALTSSKGPTGGVQTSQFFSGRFVVRQPRNERGMTEVRMSEPMKCTSSTRRGKVIASAARTRRLWGRGRGRFRTRGRNSSATVRGTTWLQKDTCTTTTTTVREGTVIVKDFAKRKNVRVKAPRRYVARARKR